MVWPPPFQTWGSVTTGDYQGQSTSSSISYLLDLNYKFSPSKSSSYRGLQELIISWMNESEDHDVREWPDIEKELNENRLKFRNDI
jgi:hypothetical protein